MPADRNAAQPALESQHAVSRLPLPDRAQLPDQVRAILEDEAGRYGAPLNPTLVLAHHPALLAAYKAWGKAMNGAALIPATLKYLVYVRVATLIGCPF